MAACPQCLPMVSKAVLEVERDPDSEESACPSHFKREDCPHTSSGRMDSKACWLGCLNPVPRPQGDCGSHIFLQRLDIVTVQGAVERSQHPVPLKFPPGRGTACCDK
jgi:hypothetical protein